MLWLPTNALVIWALITIASKASSLQESSPVIQTSHGAIKGYTDQADDGRPFYGFKGIPFAQPPVEKLRFKDPLPAVFRDDILDAVDDATPCVQFPFGDNIVNDWSHLYGSEDCLFLNVFTPTVDRSVKLPVMVFFHGGAYFYGFASQFPPHSMLVEDIVLVVVQYRIGTFGFLSTEDAAAPGNLGLKDQTLALEWVQQNIKGFGGNPSLVTLFGESAGGASVHFHTMTDYSQGLFQRAILQSGTAICLWSTTTNAKDRTYVIGRHLGCVTDDAHVNTEQLIQCLQTKDVAELANTYSLFFEFGIFPVVMAPIVDGDYIKDQPARLMSDGRVSKVDLMTGITTDDGAFVSSMVYSIQSMYAGMKDNFTAFGPLSVGIEGASYNPLELTDKVYKYYMGDNYDFREQPEKFNELNGERFFKVCSDMTALNHLQAIKGTDKQVYVYEYNYKGAHSFLDALPMQYLKDSEYYRKKWVCHADDLASLFPGSIVFAKHENEQDKEMTRIIVKLWANFAATGNPTPDDSLGFVWEAAGTQLKQLVIGEASFMKEDHRQKSREFWSALPTPENILDFPEKFGDAIEKMNNSKDEL